MVLLSGGRVAASGPVGEVMARVDLGGATGERAPGPSSISRWPRRTARADGPHPSRGRDRGARGRPHSYRPSGCASMPATSCWRWAAAAHRDQHPQPAPRPVVALGPPPTAPPRSAWTSPARRCAPGSPRPRPRRWGCGPAWRCWPWSRAWRSARRPRPWTPGALRPDLARPGRCCQMRIGRQASARQSMAPPPSRQMAGRAPGRFRHARRAGRGTCTAGRLAAGAATERYRWAGVRPHAGGLGDRPATAAACPVPGSTATPSPPRPPSAPAPTTLDCHTRSLQSPRASPCPRGRCRAALRRGNGQWRHLRS